MNNNLHLIINNNYLKSKGNELIIDHVNYVNENGYKNTRLFVVKSIVGFPFPK